MQNVQLLLFSDRAEIDKHLKTKFKDHQSEKEGLLNDIDDLN